MDVANSTAWWLFTVHTEGEVQDEEGILRDISHSYVHDNS